MKKLIITLLIITSVLQEGCKKDNPTPPPTITVEKIVFKLGDIVKWNNKLNPYPTHKLVIKVIYFKTPGIPDTATCLDEITGVYYTMPVSELTL